MEETNTTLPDNIQCFWIGLQNMVNYETCGLYQIKMFFYNTNITFGLIAIWIIFQVTVQPSSHLFLLRTIWWQDELVALLTAWVGHITFSWVCCFWLASALTVWWSSFTLTDINSTGVFLLVNSINLSIVLIPLQLQPKKKVWGIFLVERVSVGGERRRVGSRGLCAERVWESLCIPVKLQARQAPSLPFSPPPQAPLQWPSLSFQSITQPIKERELGVRLNPQHTGKNTHSHIYMHTKTSLKICI